MIVDFRRNPPLSPHSPSWTALWLQWSQSDSWAPQFLRTWSGTITLSPLWKSPSKGYTSFASWGSSTCHRSCWYSSTLPSSTAERIIGTTLPTLQELYLSGVSKRAAKITLDPSHSAHSLFDLLLSGRRYRALSTRTTRHRNSFFPQAIHLMNTWH